MAFILRLAAFSGLSFAIGFSAGWGVIGLWRKRTRQRETSTPQPVSRSARLLLITLLLLMLALGITAWSFALTAYDEARETDGWPTAAGRVVTLQIEERVDDTPMSLVGNVSEARVEVALAYTYAVGGRTYTGHTIYLDERLPGGRRLVEKEQADDIRAKYPAGSTVRVLYDPDDPARAALEQDENRGLYLFGLNAGIGLCLLAGAAARWMVTRR